MQTPKNVCVCFVWEAEGSAQIQRVTTFGAGGAKQRSLFPARSVLLGKTLGRGAAWKHCLWKKRHCA